MEDLHRRAVVRGLLTFVGVAVVGSVLVATTLGGEPAATPSIAATGSGPSSSSAAPPPPEAWLTWVPGGLPEGYGDLVGTVDGISATTTAAADIAYLTASFDPDGDGVDQPPAPMAIPIDVTAVDPTFAAFIPQPERQLLQNLRPGEGILSESEAHLRGLRPGSSLLFRGGERVDVVGTLPDALMGAYELLVPRDTGRRIGVSHDRYVLFHVDPGADPTPDSLISTFRDLLPTETPYPAVEVRAPGQTAYLRANDRVIPPLLLKQRFGEFQAHQDPTDDAGLVIDPRWVQDHIVSATLPVLGTVTCHTKTLALVKRLVRELTAAGRSDRIADVGLCFAPVADPLDPTAPLPPSAWGASIELNPSSNAPGDRPSQPKSLVQEMYRLGFGWSGNDAYPQGALFRYRKPAAAKD